MVFFSQWYYCNYNVNNKKMFNSYSLDLNFTEKIWYVPARWIWFGIGTLPNLDSE